MTMCREWGDRGITEKYMRQACNLPPVEIENLAEAGGPAVALPIGMDLIPQEEQEAEDDVRSMRVLTHACIKNMLEKGYDTLTSGYFNKFELPAGIPRGKRADLFARLESSAV